MVGSESSDFEWADYGVQVHVLALHVPEQHSRSLRHSATRHSAAANDGAMSWASAPDRVIPT